MSSNILVIEDEAPIRESVAELLELEVSQPQVYVPVGVREITLTAVAGYTPRGHS